MVTVMVELLGDPKQRNPEWRESNRHDKKQRNCFCNRNILTTKKKTQNKHSPQPYTTKNKPTQPYCTKQSASSNNLRIFWRSKHKFIIAKNPNPNPNPNPMGLEPTKENVIETSNQLSQMSIFSYRLHE
jgi:hypothetical protein